LSATGQEEPPGLRVFVCLRLPGELIDRVRELQQRLKRRLGEMGIRWTPPDQWHLTLRFLGSVPAAEITPLARALGEVGRHTRPFTLVSGGLGCFPAPARPRVLWLGVGGATRELGSLHRAVADHTAAWGDHEESRPFAPHLTLARFRPEARCQADLARLLTEESADVAGDWSVADLCLMESELLAGGARHSVLAEVPFEGTPPPSG
jgi:2'-5' RNA ligase